jgi:hypothetical protein
MYEIERGRASDTAEGLTGLVIRERVADAYRQCRLGHADDVETRTAVRS